MLACCPDLQFTRSTSVTIEMEPAISGPIVYVSHFFSCKDSGFGNSKIDKLDGPTVALIVGTRNQLGSAARGAIEEIFFVALRRPN
jgi:hypothetical protein